VVNVGSLLRLQVRGGARRGATRRGAQPRAARAGWLVPGLIVLLLIAAGELGFNALREVANVPIKKVTVNGDFRFLDKAAIEQIMLPHLGTGYFMVDLAGIRDDLRRLPMVHEVTVRRAWPDRLMVFITEQVPVLRFGEDAYLNPYAEVFRPAEVLPGLDLPLVHGPDGSEELLLRTFDAFSELLEPAGLRIARLVLDGKHAWRLTLGNGVEVLLGRRDVENKARTAARLLGGEWAAERDRVERLDMRYSNGVAVAWRGDPPKVPGSGGAAARTAAPAASAPNH
jgi:cell division protein FtsQ